VKSRRAPLTTSSVTPDSRRGGLDAAGPVLQPLLGDHPAAEQGRLEDLERRLALLGLVPSLQRRRRELRAQPHAVDDIFQTGRAKAGRHGS
jgi:hypothetical protein